MNSKPFRLRNVIAVAMVFCALPFALALIACAVVAAVLYGIGFALVYGAILIHTDSTPEDKVPPWRSI